MVEIFGTYNRPPIYGHSDNEINVFLRNDAPPFKRPEQPWRRNPFYPPAQPPIRDPVYPPATRPDVRPPPSIFESRRRSTTIRPNPFENDNGLMNHLPEGSVTTTKFGPVHNFTIREPPTTDVTNIWSTAATEAVSVETETEEAEVAEVDPEEPENATEEPETKEPETEEPTTKESPTEKAEVEAEEEESYGDEDHEESTTAAVDYNEDEYGEDDYVSKEQLTEKPEVTTRSFSWF